MAEPTFFAPSERASEDKIAEQVNAVNVEPYISIVIDAVPEMILVLNEQRQIVAVNKKLLSTIGVSDQAILNGLRPGEAVSCIYSKKGPGGCGTSNVCSTCGLVNVLLTSQESGQQVDGECGIILSSNGGTSLDLGVQATPVTITGTTFTVISLKDIGSDKRRKVLENTFFHDILNTIGGISGIAGILRDSDGKDKLSEIEYKQILVDLSDNLIEEISQQRLLLTAENGEYVPDLEKTELKKLLEDVCRLYANHIRTPGRSITMENIPECQIITDRAMLRRVIGNMVINALEATPPGGTVAISLFEHNAEVFISVVNPGEIPAEVQLKIFKRSFSTKSSSGRGIGTYSMKLFGERYLGGKVTFKSNNGQTIFSLRLPIGTI